MKVTLVFLVTLVIFGSTQYIKHSREICWNVNCSTQYGIDISSDRCKLRRYLRFSIFESPKVISPRVCDRHDEMNVIFVLFKLLG